MQPEIKAEIIACRGLPSCPFEGDDAVQNQKDGCQKCTRIFVDELGHETQFGN